MCPEVASRRLKGCGAVPPAQGETWKGKGVSFSQVDKHPFQRERTVAIQQLGSRSEDPEKASQKVVKKKNCLQIVKKPGGAINAYVRRDIKKKCFGKLFRKNFAVCN